MNQRLNCNIVNPRRIGAFLGAGALAAVLFAATAGAQQTTAAASQTAPATAPTTFPGALMKIPAGPPPPMAKPFVAAPAAKKPVAGSLQPSPGIQPTPVVGPSKTLQK